MTLEEKVTVQEKPTTPVSGVQKARSDEITISLRERPILHPAVDPPLCQVCRQANLSFFDPHCPTCQDLLLNPATTIPQMFAILRQWSPQTQQNIHLIIQEILKRGANSNDRDGLTDMTLLHYSAKSGAQGIGDPQEACEMTKLLLQKEADVFVRCRWTNMTALHYAVYFDVSPVVKLLLEHSRGIDVDSRCTEFEHGTSLHMAAANLSYESAKTLIAHQADHQAIDGLGRTPLDCMPDASNFDPESDMARLAEKMKQLLTEPPPPPTDAKRLAEKAEAMSAEFQSELDALGVQLGDRVVVGGFKCGLLRFCGRTQFATGVWAGIELEEAAGKNDGSVAGVAYFMCSPKYGIFAPLSKLSRPGATTPSVTGSKGATFRSPGATLTPSHGKTKRVNVTKVKSKIDTGLRRSLSLMTPPGGASSAPGEEEYLEVGERVLVGGHRRGVIRYSGTTDFAPGWWYGLELDRPDGKNDGTVNGRQYFSCRPRHGVFAPPSRVQRLSDLGSRESLDSLSSFDRQRRLSAGSSGSQGNLMSTPTSTQKKPLQRHHSKSKLHSISENTKRPKTAGTIGQIKRSLSQPGLQVPSAAVAAEICEGATVLCNNELGTVRYVGPVDFAEGTWLGVELRSPKGKNDGSVQGHRYFTCKAAHGLLVRPSKVTLKGTTGAKSMTEKGATTATEKPTDETPSPEAPAQHIKEEPDSSTSEASKTKENSSSTRSNTSKTKRDELEKTNANTTENKED